MQNPNPRRDLADQVTRTWEAYGDKNLIFYQHLEPLDKAQQALSQLMAQMATHRPEKEINETSVEFLTNFLKSVLKARIKMEKYKKFQDDIEFAKILDKMLVDIQNSIDTDFSIRDIPIKDFIMILFNIGRLYERLGYSSPERLKIRTPLQSDLQISGTQTPEEMERAPESESGFFTESDYPNDV